MADERKRLTALERECLMLIDMTRMTCGGVLDEKSMRKLVGRAKNGWTRYRQAMGILDKLVDEILDTVPIDQLKKLAASYDALTVRAVRKTDAVKLEDDAWVMDQHEIVTLCAAAVENTCLLCDKSEYWKCSLHQVLKDMPIVFEEHGKMYCKCLSDGGVEI